MLKLEPLLADGVATVAAAARATRPEHGLAAAAVLAAAAFLLWAWRRASLDLYKIPEAPSNWPILGILPDYWRHSDIAALQLRCVEQANAGPFVRVRAAHKHVVIVADPAAAAEILSRSGPHRVPRKVPEYAAFDIATGLHGHHSILTEQDEPRWVAVRKALAPAYGAAAIRENWPWIVDAYRTMGRRIAAAVDAAAAERKAAAAGGNGAANAGGAPADVHIDHLALAASVQLQVEGLFRVPADAKKCIDELQIASDLEAAIGAVHNYGVAPWNKLIHFALPWATAEGRQLHPARRRLAEAFTAIYDHVAACPPPEAGDVTLGACLRRLRDPHTGAPPPVERLLAEVGNQIMAPETAAHTLSWALFCVATHPDVEARLLEELRAAGLPCDGDLEGALTALEAAGPDALTPQSARYLTAVLNESMRMYPAGASASPRLTERPTRVGPYMVPAGVMVFPCLHVINNWSGNWEDPRKFTPDRWLVPPGSPDPALDPASGAPRFLPFSSGPKACIGGALGLVAVRTAAAALLSTYQFSLAERMGPADGIEGRTKLALTLKVEGGMWLSTRRRAPAPATAAA
ncbi:MAG: cytochrome P450 [Monoraphidium minutum]|nr:MAG: cytochrome P450 [Monoraphidium minutum]